MSDDIEHEPWRSTEYGNLALVRAVKERPCLYNNTIPEYSNKDKTAAAWQEIADEFGCSVPILKKQWLRLRRAYAKDLSLAKKGKKTKHYIRDHLGWIDPFVIKNQQTFIKTTFQQNICDVLQETIMQKQQAESHVLEDSTLTEEECAMPAEECAMNPEECAMPEEECGLSEAECAMAGEYYTIVEEEEQNQRKRRKDKKREKNVHETNVIGVLQIKKELQKAISELGDFKGMNLPRIPPPVQEPLNMEGISDINKELKKAMAELKTVSRDISLEGKVVKQPKVQTSKGTSRTGLKSRMLKKNHSSPKEPEVPNLKGILELNKSLHHAVKQLKDLNHDKSILYPDINYPVLPVDENDSPEQSVDNSVLVIPPSSCEIIEENFNSSPNIPQTIKEEYLLGLLPEVEEMSEGQFRLFKRKMFILIDDIKKLKK